MRHDQTFQPEWTLHPGATIADLLARRRLHTTDLARQLGTSVDAAHCLLDGNAALTSETASKLEVLFGAPAAFWLRRESQYREDLDRLAAALDSSTKEWAAEFPVAEMIRLGWIEDSKSSSRIAQECLSFFGVNSLPEWRRSYGSLLENAAYRTSPSFSSNPAALAAWARRGELVANRMDCTAWNANVLRESLPALRGLTRMRDPERFIPLIQQYCAAAGVGVAVVPAPSGCKASGMTRFVSRTKALLLLSGRYRSDDHFWFSFFHEVGHLLLHSHESIFVEGVGVESAFEQQANDFASQLLIPQEYEPATIATPLDAKSLIVLAKKIGISPGILVGQLQHRGRLGRHQMNHLRRRYEWSPSDDE